MRLFVAAYPPRAFARCALEALRGVGMPANRETAVEQVHLTLQNIGDTEAGRVGEVSESVARSASGIGVFTLRAVRLITLPERGAARLVALETDAPGALLELQRRLATRLARKPREKAGDRFVPHLTLCRFRGAEAGLRVNEGVELGGFEVGEIALMRSVLRPGGAEHREVARFGLG